MLSGRITRPSCDAPADQLIVDYNPTEPGGLCISKNDRLVFIHVGDGWCLGKNLTKGGQEGIFPKRKPVIDSISPTRILMG